MNWSDSELRRAAFVDKHRLDLAEWIPGERDFVKIRDDKPIERKQNGNSIRQCRVAAEDAPESTNGRKG